MSLVLLKIWKVKFKFKRFGNCPQSQRDFQCPGSCLLLVLTALYFIPSCHLTDVLKHKLLIFKSSVLGVFLVCFIMGVSVWVSSLSCCQIWKSFLQVFYAILLAGRLSFHNMPVTNISPWFQIHSSLPAVQKCRWAFKIAFVCQLT